MNSSTINCETLFKQFNQHEGIKKKKHYTGETPYNCILPRLNNHGFCRFDKLMQQQKQTQISDLSVPDLIRNKKKSVVIKSLAELRTQKDCDEIMEDLFSISDSSLSSDEEDGDEETGNQDQAIQQSTAVQTQAQAHMLLLPHLADYLVKNPDEPPENFLFRHYHRLSLQDLCYPIENIGHIIQSCNSVTEGVYITIDEFEALQGFSRFSTIN